MLAGEEEMFFRIKVCPSLWASVVIPRRTEDRLRTTCFRGSTRALAGNFSCWNSARNLFQDKTVRKQLSKHIVDMWSEGIFETQSIQITCKESIGWESTVPIEIYAPEVLERFDLNRRSFGLRIKRDRTDLLAPQTQKLTLVVEFRCENDQPKVIVHSMYPGEDIGELDGDVTDREQRVFFDWNHPGKC